MWLDFFSPIGGQIADFCRFLQNSRNLNPWIRKKWDNKLFLTILQITRTIEEIVFQFWYQLVNNCWHSCRFASPPPYVRPPWKAPGDTVLNILCFTTAKLCNFIKISRIDQITNHKRLFLVPAASSTPPPSHLRVIKSHYACPSLYILKSSLFVPSRIIIYYFLFGRDKELIYLVVSCDICLTVLVPATVLPQE